MLVEFATWSSPSPSTESLMMQVTMKTLKIAMKKMSIGRWRSGNDAVFSAGDADRASAPTAVLLAVTDVARARIAQVFDPEVVVGSQRLPGRIGHAEG